MKGKMSHLIYKHTILLIECYPSALSCLGRSKRKLGQDLQSESKINGCCDCFTCLWLWAVRVSGFSLLLSPLFFRIKWAAGYAGSPLPSPALSSQLLSGTWTPTRSGISSLLFPLWIYVFISNSLDLSPSFLHLANLFFFDHAFV